MATSLGTHCRILGVEGVEWCSSRRRFVLGCKLSWDACEVEMRPHDSVGAPRGVALARMKV